MTDLPIRIDRFWSRRRAVLAAIAVAAVFVFANAHLFTVAFGSLPECVPHLKAPVEGSGFRAASPSC